MFERAQYLSPQDYLAHISAFQENQDHVTSLCFQNDYFIRQLRKELKHDYPMVADDPFITPQHSSLLSQAPGYQPLIETSAGG